MSTLLDANTLKQIRADQARAMPDTCNVQRLTRASDGAGGWTQVWATVATGVACRLTPTGGHENVLASKIGEISTWTVTLPHATSVTAKDRLVLSGRTFYVSSTAAGGPHGAWRTTVRAVCTEIV